MPAAVKTAQEQSLFFALPLFLVVRLFIRITHAGTLTDSRLQALPQRRSFSRRLKGFINQIFPFRIQCFHSLPDVLKWPISADDLQRVGELQKEIHFFLDWRVLGKQGAESIGQCGNLTRGIEQPFPAPG